MYDKIHYKLKKKKKKRKMNLPASAGDTKAVDSIPGSGRFSGVGNGIPLQYS